VIDQAAAGAVTRSAACTLCRRPLLRSRVAGREVWPVQGGMSWLRFAQLLVAMGIAA